MDKFWLGLGFTAQVIFGSRFLVQWIASERAGRSIIPEIFWVLSLFGGLLLFSYAVWRRDPVFILGQSTGIFVYSRNLWFIHRDKGKGEKKPQD